MRDFTQGRIRDDLPGASADPALDATAGPAGAGARPADLGAEIYELAAELYPICRSLAGNGVRQTLSIVDREIGLACTEVRTGTPLFDWTAPREWQLREAWVEDQHGRRVIDAAQHNLHVVNGSVSVRARLSRDELRPHLHSLPEQPELIPYRTSYWSAQWGFCLRHADLERLGEGPFEVCIDAEHRDGAMTYGEHLVRGRSTREILFATHICHPSLANDNCSGIAVLCSLARTLEARGTQFSYRFLFAPAIVGALAWLTQHRNRLPEVAGGIVVSCLGDGGGPTFKRSRRGDGVLDRAMRQVLRHAGEAARVEDFSPYGYDERQYCAPGFNLPVGLFQRSKYASFPEYHTSADNMDFIRPEHLASSHDFLLEAIEMLEDDWTPVNLAPFGEPQLGRRGLYPATGGPVAEAETLALLWVLNLADGQHSLLDMAERSGLRFRMLATSAERLQKAGLLAEDGTTAGVG